MTLNMPPRAPAPTPIKDRLSHEKHFQLTKEQADRAKPSDTVSLKDA